MFKELTGEELKEFLSKADREETLGNAHLVLHCAITLANEIGTPKGQRLTEEQDGPAPPVKKQTTEGSNLEERVEDLKKKVKLLVQMEPSGALILLTLEEQASVSRLYKYSNTETVEELYLRPPGPRGW